jgi:cell cycle sensor histidine kinase DivJ
MSGHENGTDIHFSNALEKLNALLEAAQTGALIPIRLPGQIEEIVNDVKSAQEASEQALAQAKKASASAPPDMEEYMAEEAYFVGHAVHELRTPMTSIRGYTDMLGSMGELTDMQKQFMDVIKTNIKRMEGLLADVSYINKVRKNTLKLTPKMDMFKNLAMRIEKDWQPLADELGRELVFEIPQGLPFLNLDGDMLTTALGKLVENALRYTPAEGGKVTISAKANGNKLEVIVEDNGFGMTEEEIAQLGTIYFRSDRDEVREYKGSGLGIPIAYGMVTMMDGTINVESTPDVGTRFIVSVPAIS